MADKKPVATATNDDISKNKVLAVLAYFGILFLVPYLTAKESPYAQYHAKQGFNLLVLWAGAMFIFTAFPVIGWLVGAVGYLVVLALFVLGVVNAANGQMKPLPIIGDWQLLK